MTAAGTGSRADRLRSWLQHTGLITCDGTQPAGPAHEPLQRVHVLLIVLLLLLYAALSLLFQLHQHVSGDQMQMLHKGLLAAITGEYLPYGNEASTVGNVPGSLSSVLIGLPLSLYMHPLSPVVLLIVLRLIGVLLFADALHQLFSARTVVTGVMLYALNPWFLYDNVLYNPAYLSFGAALALSMLVRLRKAGQAKLPFSQCFVYSMLLTLATGWCLQLHFSWPVLVALSGLLWLTRSIQFSFTGLFCGLLLLAASLIPYLQEALVNHYITSNPEEYARDRYFGYGLVHVYPLFKAVLYWLRFGSLLVTKKAMLAGLPDGAALWQEGLYYLWLVLTQAAGVLTVVLSAVCNYVLLRRGQGSADPAVRFVRSLTLCSLGAMLLAAAAATLVLNYWQIIIMFCFALLPVLLFAEKYRPSLRFLWGLGVFMVLMNTVSALSSDKFSYRESYVQAVHAFCLKSYSAAQCGLSTDLVQEP